MKQVLTLVYLVQNGAICLGQKKRGFGVGNWNGFGGKVEQKESIEAAAVRELKEESGVTARIEDLQKVAIINFFFADGRHMEVHAFFVDRWEGDPKETEEMNPAWFTFHDIPFERMWADDRYWLPRALKGEKLSGSVSFKADETSIEAMEWNATAAL